MVNSGSYENSAGTEGDSVKGDFTQLEGGVTRTAASPRHIVGACAREDDFTAATAEMVSPKETIEEDSKTETADPTERESGLSNTYTSLLDLVKNETETTLRPEKKTSLHCSVPLSKVKDVLNLYTNNENLVSSFILENLLKKSSETSKNTAPPKRLLCLFCDRTFQTLSLKQKHVDRCHSSGQSRRSSRTPGPQSATACSHCSKLNNTEHSWNQLFEHMINEHSNRYFACLTCQERFSSLKFLQEHNKIVHNIEVEEIAKLVEKKEEPIEKTDILVDSVGLKEETTEERVTTSPESIGRTRSKRNLTIKSPKLEEIEKDTYFEENINATKISAKDIEEEAEEENGVEEVKNNTKAKTNKNRNKKLSVKSKKNGVRTLRTRRAAAISKQLNSEIIKLKGNKKRNNNSNNKTNSNSNNKSEKKDKEVVSETKTQVNSSSVFSLVNLFTYKYEKIYDHASDSIKDANSGKFDAVFDKEFYARTVNNIKENLLLHLDGKLNRNIQSENRISNFEHVPTEDAKISKDSSSERNYGSDISLNAVTPVATLLSSSQYGEDFDSQIEYAAKATQKKTKKDKNLKYKFPNRKFNSLFRDKGEHSDLTSLDMWTQLKIKERQHFLHEHEMILPSRQIAKKQVDELNRILDTRGPFEDLKIEQQAAMDEMKSKKNQCNEDIGIVVDELLERVFSVVEEKSKKQDTIKEEIFELNSDTNLDIPNYLNLERSPKKELELDKSDKITMICVADTEVKSVELTGEWARPRIYICATCAQKLPNLKSLDEHKNISHPNIWCTHYEFVGKQSEFYRHLGIPGLGKVGIIEMMPQTKFWQKSDARLCTKCAKQCNSLSELHRHMLECGGDWTWMLARKKVKYRPYGARTRRRRQRGKILFIYRKIYEIKTLCIHYI